MIQVAAKSPLLLLLMQVDIRRTDQPKIRFFPGVAADRLKPLFLNNTQQPRLQR